MQRILVFFILLSGRIEDGLQLVASYLTTRYPAPFGIRDCYHSHLQGQQCAYRDASVGICSPAPAARAFRSLSHTLLLSSKENEVSQPEEFVEAEDLEALQALFSKYCDKEGLMTKAAVMKVPAIAELMVSRLCTNNALHLAETLCLAHEDSYALELLRDNVGQLYPLRGPKKNVRAELSYRSAKYSRSHIAAGFSHSIPSLDCR